MDDRIGGGRRWLALACALALGVTPAAASAQADSGDSVAYVLSAASRFQVKTGKAGLLGFAGHDHVIRARAFSGRIIYSSSRPAASRVDIVVPTDSLEVLTPPDTSEIRKVTETMRTRVLDVAHHPEIRFVSRAVTPQDSGFLIQADLTIADRTRQVPVYVKVQIGADTLRASATFVVKQTDFGITPYRGGPAGTVRVADRVTFGIEAVAVRDDTVPRCGVCL